MPISLKKRFAASALALAMTAISGTALAQGLEPASMLPQDPPQSASSDRGFPLDNSEPPSPGPLNSMPSWMPAPSGPGGESAAESIPDSFAVYDTNDDGRLSQSETKGNAGFNRTFILRDLNQDGYLSPAEYAGSGSAFARSSKPGK